MAWTEAIERALKLDLPVTVTSQNALYGTPNIVSSLDAVEYAVHADTWSTLPAAQRIVQNITVSGTYSISAQFCTPKTKSKPDKSQILQIDTHGWVFDKRYDKDILNSRALLIVYMYWDAEVEPESYSYVSTAVSAGYSVLSYDRLGTGLSDKPDAYKVVQAPLELRILREITTMARTGVLLDLLQRRKDCPAAIKTVSQPQKVIHVGHSFGSFLSSALITSYGNLSDSAIITGLIPNKELSRNGATISGFEIAHLVDPIKFEKLSGYLVQRAASNVQTIFFHQGSFDPKLLAYANKIKLPLTVGEYDSVGELNLGYGPAFQGPLQYMEAEFDFPICDGDCKNTDRVASLKQIYPHAKIIEAYIQPGAGHGLTLHRNATAGYEVSLKFLVDNGL